MGLDITAYSRLKLAPGIYDLMEEDDDYDPWGMGYIQGFAYDSFAASTRGLQGHDEPTPGNAGWIGTGWYERTVDTEEHDFQAGSYTGYGAWRDDLATFGVHMLSTGASPIDLDHLRVPFIELTYFADNEGCIGPEAARDLLADFTAHEAAYKSSHSQYDNERYDDWKLACQLAADGGLIQLH